jgi:hypothetical protein
MGNLYASSFTASTGFDLGLNNNGSPDLGCCRFGFGWGVCNKSLKNRNLILLEKIACLILE